LKIIHTEASPGWGGQEIRILKESLGMIKRGHEVVFILQKGGGLVNQAKKHGIKVYELVFTKKRIPQLVFELLSIFRKENVQLVNTHSSVDAWSAGIAARLFRVPVIRTRHLSSKIRAGLNSILLYNKLADYVVTTCKEIVPVIQKQSKRSPSTVSSIATGIDVSEVIAKKKQVSNFRKEHNYSENDFIVGMVCFMRSWKGVDDFIQAANLAKDIPNLKWVIIGGGHQDKYLALAKKLNLKNLFFTGHLDNPFPAIEAIDVFSLLSTGHEGVSQASLQAALFEKPLITTPTGGLKEVCITNKTGIQVPCFSPEKVKDAVVSLMNDPDKCKLYGQTAKKLVEESFSYEAMLDRTEKIYELIS